MPRIVPILRLLHSPRRSRAFGDDAQAVERVVEIVLRRVEVAGRSGRPHPLRQDVAVVGGRAVGEVRGENAGVDVDLSRLQAVIVSPVSAGFGRFR